MIPARSFAGKKVALFGLGGSGIATGRALMEGGADVLAWDYAPDYGWASVPPESEEPVEPFSLPYPAPVRVEPAGDPVIRSPATIRQPATGMPGLWSWTDELGEPAVAAATRIDLRDIEISRGCISALTLCAAFRPESGVQGCPCQSVSFAGGSFVIPSHQTSPSGVRATFVKIQFLVSVAIAFGFDSIEVPGATPK